jgi:hypothetical protein
MPGPHFEETQLFRNNRWVWFLFVPFSLLLFLPLLYGLYWQLMRGQPWGNEPMSDEGLLILFLAAMASWACVMWILLSVSLETRVDEEGIHFKFFPHRPQWTLIRKQDIASYEIRRKRNFFEGGIIGYHRNILTKTRSMTIRGRVHLQLLLVNGQKFNIGTQDPDGMERAMRRLMSTP